MDATTDLQELEQRVTRLEEALARQAVVVEEEAVVQKVLTRLKALAAERRHQPHSAEDGMILTPPPPSSVVSLPPEPPPEGAILPMQSSHSQAEPGSIPSDTTASSHRLWSWLQSLADLRLMLAMYFDPHYRMSRLTQLGLLALVGLVVFDYFFFAVWFSVPFVSPILERLLIVMATLIAYKLIKLELIRYRRVRDYMSRWYNRPL
jgi:hypothetical protein